MQFPSLSLRLYWPIWIVAILSCVPEIILQLSDAGFLGQIFWRPLAYQYGGFWSGLLRDWQPNYAAQPWTMFGTYAVLHAGASHLAGNLAVLVWLGPVLCRRLGAWPFMAIYLVSIVGGAAAFGLLSASNAPMVGASGALFGLAGAWVVTEYRATLRRGDTPGTALRHTAILCLMLVVLNVVTWFIEDGVLAWQTHLGGFLTGAGLAFLGTAKSAPAPTQPAAKT